MPDNEHQGSQSPVALGYLAPICVAVFFVFVWILVGTRHRLSRNRTGLLRPLDPESWPLGYSHVVLTANELETRFPLVKYSSWWASHRGNDPHKDIHGTNLLSDRNAHSDPKSPLPSVHSLDSQDKEVSQETRRSGDGGTPTGDNNTESDSYSLCAICMEYFEDDDSLRSLSCGHIFHAACLDPWFTKRQSRCPLCKTCYLPDRPALDGTRVFVAATSAMPIAPRAALVRTQVFPRVL